MRPRLFLSMRPPLSLMLTVGMGLCGSAFGQTRQPIDWKPCQDFMEQFRAEIDKYNAAHKYDELHWSASEWNEELMKRNPAHTTAVCMAGKLINGESACAVIYLSCRDDQHPRFSKAQCQTAKAKQEGK